MEADVVERLKGRRRRTFSDIRQEVEIVNANHIAVNKMVCARTHRVLGYSDNRTSLQFDSSGNSLELARRIEVKEV